MQFLLLIPLAFLLAFLLLPLLSLLLKALSIGLLGVAFPILTENLTSTSFFTSINLALVVTLGALALASLLSFLLLRFRIPGSGILRVLLILPIIVPPFVTGIGIRKLFARFGPINLALIDCGILDKPIDWLGISGFLGVALAEILHYYPIILLSLLSSAAALDFSLIQAARLSGASRFRLVFEIIFPLFLPSTLASLTLVFAWSFTELGTPLVFDYRAVLPVKLFTALDDLHTNPRGYVYVILVLLVALLAGLFARQLLKNKQGLAFSSRGAMPIPQIVLSGTRAWLLSFAILFATTIFLLPHLGLLVLSFSERWNMSIWPEQFTLHNFVKLSSHPLVIKSIAISLILATLSCLLLLIVGGLNGFVGRGRSKLSRLVTSLSNLSLIIPGIVLAYAYLETFRGSIIDARINPLPILVFAYAIRRLPVVVSSISSALSISATGLEEAARLCGSTAYGAFRKITLPLAMPFITSAMILSFIFAMFEVSESLMLAQQEQFFPISKTMYALLNRPDGPGMACALGVLAFFITLFGILIAAKISGRKFEELFRIS